MSIGNGIGPRVPAAQRDSQKTGVVTAGVAVERIRAVLKHKPSALITDIDGTISRIVPRPEDANVSEAVRSALRQIKEQLALTAVITGRPQDWARAIVGVEGITYVGHYGLTDEADAGPGLNHYKTRVQLEIEGLAGVVLEEKGVSFSLHYRHAPDAAAAHAAVLEIAGRIAQESGAKIIESKRVVEVVPADLPDKGDAIVRLLTRHGIARVVYFGDDLPDIPVFEELAKRRRRGMGDSLSVAVVDEETEPAVIERADICLEGVGGLEEVLTLLAAELESEAAPGG